MMKGIIFSLMRNYKRQNSNHSDYKAMATKIFYRHIARGCEHTTMKTWILEADSKIRIESTTALFTNNPTEETTDNNNNRVFLHFEYHCNNIPKKAVCVIYERHCQATLSKKLGIQNLTIAYSRSKNIKDLVTKAKLHQAPGKEASKFYVGGLPLT